MADQAPEKPKASTTPEEMAQAEKILADGAGAAKAPAGEKAASQAHGTAKKKGAAGKDEKSVGGRLSATLALARAQFADIFKSLASPDRPTRRMAFLFFLSLAGLLGLGAVVIQSVLHQRAMRHAAELAAQELEAADTQDDDALDDTQDDAAEGHASAHGKGGPGGAHGKQGHSATSMLGLGLFTIELAPAAGKQGKRSPLTDYAEVDLFVECDSQEAYEYLEENLVQARNEVTGVLLSTDRAELLSREGKRALKRKLLDKLNGWLPHGSIRNIYFSRLVVS